MIVPNFIKQALAVVVLFGFGQVLAQALPVSVANKLNEAGIAKANASFLAVSLDNHQPIINHLANTPRIPASTQKLITTAAALDMLGANFAWRTDIYHTGVLANGIVYGDVVIVGSGDPSMDHQRLEALLGELSKKVGHITGNIYVDDGKFSGVNYDPYAFDGQGLRAYNATPNAFLINFGTVEVRFMPSGWHDDAGKFVVNPTATHASIQMFPKLADITHPQQIPTKKGCDLPKINITNDDMQVSGAFGVDCGNQSLWQNFGNNQSLAKQAVLATWQRHDDKFDGKIVMGKPPASTHLLPLVNTVSAPVAKQIWQINQYSNNVMTEQVALSLPLYANGESVSNYPLAFEFLGHWWQRVVGNHPPTMTRASGLCTDCWIRPTAMANLLGVMYRHKDFEIYKDSLPVAGVSGTMAGLAKRIPTHPAIGQAWIKTGRLNDVAAIAGYVQANSGKWYAVVGIINAPLAGSNPKATATLDEFLAEVVRY